VITIKKTDTIFNPQGNIKESIQAFFVDTSVLVKNKSVQNIKIGKVTEKIQRKGSHKTVPRMREIPILFVFGA